MKRKKREAIFVVFAVLLFCVMHAQETQNESIQIPDVSTNIDGSLPSVDPVAVPDFTLILPPADGDFLLSVQLPHNNTGGNTEQAESEDVTDARIALEGLIGGGFPGYFSGRFSVHRNTGKYPFYIGFSHKTQNGFGKYKAADGFMKTETDVQVKSRFFFTGNHNLGISFDYGTQTDGLQKKSPFFYTSSNQHIRGSASFTAYLPADWQAAVFAETVFTERFSATAKSLPASVSAGDRAFSAGAGAGIRWNPEHLHISFDVLYSGLFADGKKAINRGVFNADFETSLKDTWTFKSAVGILFADNLSVSVLLPFSLSVRLKRSFLAADVGGGLRSVQTDVSAFAKEYPFADKEILAAEEADWFANMDIRVPVGKTLTVNGGIDFSKTAFMQGRILPDYTDLNTQSGIYRVKKTNTLYFNTKAGLSFQSGLWGAAALWHSYWLDVRPGKARQELQFSVSLTPEKRKWAADAGLIQAFDGDYTPDIFIGADYRFVDAVSLRLEFQDAVKLCTRGLRKNAGHFAERGGTAALFVKFVL